MILFVDDEPFYISSYKEALEANDFQVSVHRKIGSAMNLFRQEKDRIELVITDIMMPSGETFKGEEQADSDLTSGFAFVDWLRKESVNTPVIVLTNNTTQDVDRKFAGDGNCFVYRKARFLTPQLVQKVREILHREPSNDGSL